jgi:ankyrin repeat protein
MAGKWTGQLQREKLHSAAQHGDLSEVEKLLQVKYPVNRFDDLGKTPLHYAVAHNHMDVVNCLIRAGANVNANDERVIGNTPLSDNAERCSFEMAQRLVQAGADPSIRGWMQMCAIDHASSRKDADAKKIQRLLLDAKRKRER